MDPGGLFYIGGPASEFVWFTWSLIYWTDHLSIWNSAYIWMHGKTLMLHPFTYQEQISLKVKHGLGQNPLKNYPLKEEPFRGLPGSWYFSDSWTDWGFPNTKSVSSKDWVDYNWCATLNSHHPVSYYIKLKNTGRSGFLNSPGDFYCSYFPW